MNIPKSSGLINKYFLYPTTDLFLPLFHKLGFTPNLVTSLTLVLRIIVFYNLYFKTNLKLIIILFFISWITDGIDGQLARKYNMKSKFGEIYDVTVDFCSIIMFLIIYYFKYYKTNLKPLLIFIIVLLILNVIKCLKLSCMKNNKLKFYENFINEYNLNITKNTCNNLYFIEYFDEGIHYIWYLIFLVYTLFLNN